MIDKSYRQKINKKRNIKVKFHSKPNGLKRYSPNIPSNFSAAHGTF
jgi:hypothetical protein